jgi:uncharacterized membrane protein
MLRKLGKTIAHGLFAALPLVLTLYVVYWIGSGAEKMFGGWIMTFFPKFYIPGMGLVIGLVSVIGIGIAAKVYIGQRLLDWGNRLVARIPLAKTLYGATKDILSLFSGERKSFSRVVLMRLPGSAHRVLGMVTREEFAPSEGFGNGVLAVYVPMSYQMGGFTYIVAKDSVETVNMSVEEALRFCVTAGVSAKAPPPLDQGQCAPETAAPPGSA